MHQATDWRKADRSNASGGECVEVAVFQDERSA
ncbi:DUF397 domain-containing protein [Actinoallomurus vinaceus]